MSYDEKTDSVNVVDESLECLQQLEDRMKNFTNELRDLRAENTSIRNEYDVLQGKLGTYEEKIRQIESWEAERESLRMENSSLKEKITVIEGRIKKILSRLEDPPIQE